MKKLTKILSIVLMVIMVLTFSANIVNAAADEDVVDDLFNKGNADTGNLESVGANIVDIVTTIGIIVAVVVLLVLGIKYMMGSASEKAETKQLIPPYVVGCVIVFGAFAIWKIVVELFNQTQV